MNDTLPKIKSPIYELRLEALRAEFLQPPAHALSDAIEQLGNALIQHGFGGHDVLLDDARWLLERMEELQDAFRLHDAPGINLEKLFCHFRRRYAACEVAGCPLR